MTELERWSPIVAYCVDETKKIYNSMSDGLLNRCKECCLKLINTDRKFREAADNYLNDEYEKLMSTVKLLSELAKGRKSANEQGSVPIDEAVLMLGVTL